MTTKKIIYLGVFLGALTAVSTGLLSKVNDMTQAPREAQKVKNTNDAIKKVLPPYDKIVKQIVVGTSEGKSVVLIDNKKNKADVAKLKDVVRFFCAAGKDGKIVGLAGLGATNKGYGGKVVAMVGLLPDGAINTVYITEQHETPGLGTVVTDRKRKKTIFTLLGKDKVDLTQIPPNKILDAYKGHKVSDKDSWGTVWAVKKDGGKADFITGATISSRAVCGVVYDIASTYMKHGKEIEKLIKSKEQGE